MVAGAKHNQAVTVLPDEYARRTLEFFDRHLAGLAGRIEGTGHRVQSTAG